MRRLRYFKASGSLQPPVAFYVHLVCASRPMAAHTANEHDRRPDCCASSWTDHTALYAGDALSSLFSLCGTLCLWHKHADDIHALKFYGDSDPGAAGALAALGCVGLQDRK